MKKINFFDSYYELLNNKVDFVERNLLLNVATYIRDAANNSGKIIIIGNGGSASIASHVVVDLTKAANIRAINFNEASLLTCFSNDYGYERWAEKAIEFYADKEDLIILISSSGQSKNIINCAIKAKEMGLPIITLSGFMKNNPLKEVGNVNLWVDSKIYNIVEMTHQIWLLSVVDYLIENDRVNSKE
jgi:D-sedoheptulose 7-phosphate isomerase